MNHQVSVDVNALTSSLRESFKQLHPVSKDRCIYRVGKRLRVLNEKDYTPQCVSIGPYHHGKDELKAMEEQKTVYLQHFLRYSKVDLDEFVSCVRNNETKLRNCYQEKIEFSSEIFVSLVLIDAAFVIMIMLKSYYSLRSFDEFRNEDELLFEKLWMICDIQNDMILLENQLPFFILDELLRLSKLDIGGVSMAKISFHFLSIRFTSWVVNSHELSLPYEHKHLVDLLSFGQKPLEPNKHTTLYVMNLPSAVELHRSGVKFRPDSSLRFLDIKFDLSDGILRTSVLRITDSTEILFRNLLAYEQSHFYTGESYFNNYITMMSSLVTNGNDVEFLIKIGIIQNWLPCNEQVVHLFHNLSKQNLLYPECFYLTDVVNDLNKYSSKRRNRWRASLIQNYFYSPGAIISVSAGAAVILLTIIQAICSILQVKQD